MPALFALNVVAPAVIVPVFCVIALLELPVVSITNALAPRSMVPSKVVVPPRIVTAELKTTPSTTTLPL